MEDAVFIIIGCVLYIGFWAVIISVIVKNVKKNKAKQAQAAQARVRKNGNPAVQQGSVSVREIIDVFRGKDPQPERPMPAEQTKVFLNEGDTAYSNSNSGSLAYDSLEGVDTCDEDLMHGQPALMRTAESGTEEQSQFEMPAFDLESVRNGFIMGEILNRPAWKR